MKFSEILIYSTGMLYLDRRVSHRRLRRELELDDEALKELCYELVTVRRIAREENGEVLVWAGEEPDRPGPVSDDPRQAAGGEAERRQLTVMFCDLEGSTELSSRTDPEDLRDIITRYQDACRTAIDRYEGFVARYMGDGLLVYFGYPQAHEDDPVRAARAGLDITRSMSSLNEVLAQDHDVDLSVRIGIATGPVVVGDLIGAGASEEAAVVGETPNLAARLQGIAESDQVVVDSAIRRLIENRFELADAGCHRLKGLADPVQAWRVLRELEQDDGAVKSGPSSAQPLIGRQEELGLLVRSWEASKSGHGQVVSIQGEAGIGKSRLYEALRAHIEGQSCLWVTVRCSPYHTHSSLYPVIAHMKRVLGWTPDDSDESRLQKLESVIGAQGIEQPDAVSLFADLMTLPLPPERYPPLKISPQQKREQILDLLAGWLFDEAEKQPVLQIWEDLHWADPTTLELLGLYIEQSPTVAMLNVLTYRPDFTPPWPARSHLTPITLNRMERPEVEALIGNVTGGKALPIEVIEHIFDKSDGVPLYVEELTKTIIESDYLVEKTDGYALSGRISDVSVPVTLHDSLMARLDRVPKAREVAQLGAVLGREFAYDMLQSLSPLDEPALKDSLDQLVGNELLYRRGRPPRARFIFKHALIHDAAYQSLLRRTRQQYHRNVATLLKEHFPDTVSANPELLAHHFTEAGEFENAVRYWLLAGDRARGVSANWEAIAHLENGLEVLEGIPESAERDRLELSMQVSLGGANIVVRGHAAPEVEKAFRRARELCHKLGDVPEILASVFGMWRFFIVCRHLGQALDLGEQLQQLCREREDDVRYVISNYAVGFTELVLGRLDAAKIDMEKAVERYDPSQRSAEVYRAAQDPCTACLSYLSNCEWLLGHPDRALERMRQCLALVDRLDDAVSLSHALCFCTITSEMCGEDTETERMAERMFTVSMDMRMAAWIIVGKLTRHWINVKRKRRHADVEDLSNDVDEFGEIGFDILRPYFLSLKARACHMTGLYDQGLQALDQARQIIEKRAETWWQPEIFRIRGDLLSASGEPRRALEAFESALELSRKLKSPSLELRAAISIAGHARGKPETDSAIQQLRRIYERFEEGFDTADLRQARTLLESAG